MLFKNPIKARSAFRVHESLQSPGWKKMSQSFRKIKLDSNDVLYSKIIRLGKYRCDMCHLVRDLECAHIVGRGHYATRFMLEPVRNAVALCASCHDWFDSHKITAVLFEEKKRVFNLREESYTWLVKGHLAYTWDQLVLLYAKGQTVFQGYSFKKKEIGIFLKEKFKQAENAI